MARFAGIPVDQPAQQEAPQAKRPRFGGTPVDVPTTDLPAVSVRPELEDQEFTLPQDPGTGDLLEYVRTYRPQLRDMPDAQLARELAGMYEKGGIPKTDFYSRTGLDKKLLGFDAKERPDPTGTGADNFRAGMGKAFVDTGRGLNQVGSWAADAIPGVDLTQHRKELQGRVDESRRLDAPLMNTDGGVFGNVAGNVAVTAVPGAPITRTAGWANRGARFAEAGARGAAFGAIQPTATGESRGKNIAIGAGAGIGGQAVASTAGRVARGASESIDDVKRAALDTLTREKIPVHFSQVSDSIPAKTAASITKYIPFSGAGKVAKSQQEAWNRAISRSFGVESPNLTDDVIDKAKLQFNTGYDDIWSRNQVTLTPSHARRMQDVIRQTERDFGKNSDAAEVVKNNFYRIMDQASDGPIPGRGYQLLRTDLAEVQPGTAIGKQVGKLRKVLIDSADQSLGPDDAAALKALDKQYNNMKVAENLLKQVAGAGGDIKPSSLWAQVNKRGPKATQQMRDLAKAGQTVLKDPIPDSGSQGRLLMGGLMAGGAAPFGGPMGALGALALGAPTARILNSPTFGNYVANGGGDTLQRLAWASGAAPYLIPAAVAGTEFGKKDFTK